MLILIMNKNSLLIILGFTLFFYLQCNKDKYKATIPAYLYIDQVKFTTDYYQQGSASHKITDVWIYIDDDLKGAFELPAKIPILQFGQHKLTIKAGIKVNGIANTRTAYPFYKEYTIYHTFIQNQTDTIIPEFTYADGTLFPYKEDFEASGLNFFYNSQSQVQFELISSGQQYEGNFSAQAHLSPNQTFFEAYTTDIYNLPKNQRPVFLELNYKCSATLVVGLFYDDPVPTTQRSLIYLNPTDQWNKIYINLTEALTYQQSASKHMISFGFINENAQDLYIAIDNIKVVTR